MSCSSLNGARRAGQTHRDTVRQEFRVHGYTFNLLNFVNIILQSSSHCQSCHVISKPARGSIYVTRKCFQHSFCEFHFHGFVKINKFLFFFFLLFSILCPFLLCSHDTVNAVHGQSLVRTTPEAVSDLDHTQCVSDVFRCILQLSCLSFDVIQCVKRMTYRDEPHFCPGIEDTGQRSKRKIVKNIVSRCNQRTVGQLFYAVLMFCIHSSICRNGPVNCRCQRPRIQCI